MVLRSCVFSTLHLFFVRSRHLFGIAHTQSIFLARDVDCWISQVCWRLYNFFRFFVLFEAFGISICHRKVLIGGESVWLVSLDSSWGSYLVCVPWFSASIWLWLLTWKLIFYLRVGRSAFSLNSLWFLVIGSNKG